MTQRFVAHTLFKPYGIKLTPISSALPAASSPSLQTGIYCHWQHPFVEGQNLRLFVPNLTREAAADTQVIACQMNELGYQLMLAFIDEEQVFRFRMVEQLCHIHQYHQLLQHRGRRLSLNEAAGEWIDRFAGSFNSATAPL